MNGVSFFWNGPTLVCIFLLGVLCTANEPESSVNEEMRVNLVELIVRAEGMSGKKIRGLGIDDFVVTEGGKRQTIDSIEEVYVHQSEGVHSSDRNRLMILLDFNNTESASIRTVFGHLREFVKEFDMDTGDLGLSYNLGGIKTVQPFTKDRQHFLDALNQTEAFYNKKGFRSASTQQMIRDQVVNRADYFRQQVEVLGQFVNYLGAYNGRKNLLLISNPWLLGRAGVQEGRRNQKGVVSLRDIQTTAQFNKVTINFLNIEPSPTATESKYLLDQNEVALDPSADLAANTSGVYYRVNRGGMAVTLDRVSDDLSHFYRIRYYTNVTHERYRRVKVKVKGMGQIGNHFAGFFPESALSPKQTVVGVLRGDAFAQALAVETDWLSWQRSGRRERGVDVVISYRAFDELGQMIAEQVEATKLRVKKKKGAYTYPYLAQKVQFRWAEHEKPVRFEARVVDMTTGERIVIQNTLASL